jgi:integrase
MNDYKIDRHKFFDTEERQQILTVTEALAVKDERRGLLAWPTRWMLVHLAMQTGLRVSEIASLKIKFIRLNVKDPYIIVKNGKGGKSRDVYIDSQLADHLRYFLEYYRADATGDQPLFKGSTDRDNARNGHLTTNALYLSFKKAVKAANLRTDLTIHSARHTYATLLLHKTQNLRYVQKQLGHSSLNMTALYSDIFPEENGKLANMILDETKPKHLRQ